MTVLSPIRNQKLRFSIIIKSTEFIHFVQFRVKKSDKKLGPYDKGLICRQYIETRLLTTLLFALSSSSGLVLTLLRPRRKNSSVLGLKSGWKYSSKIKFKLWNGSLLSEIMKQEFEFDQFECQSDSRFVWLTCMSHKAGLRTPQKRKMGH